MKKISKIALIVLLAVFIVIQFFRPERTSTNDLSQNDLTKKMRVPDSVQKILKRSCYDCHSNQTFWPWYSNIAPFSWMLAKDVRNGRAKMNFSEWGKMSESKQEARLEAICDQVTEGEMPLPQYLYIHRDAVLNQQEKDILCKWTEDELKKREETE